MHVIMQTAHAAYSIATRQKIKAGLFTICWLGKGRGVNLGLPPL